MVVYYSPEEVYKQFYMKGTHTIWISLYKVQGEVKTTILGCWIHTSLWIQTSIANITVNKGSEFISPEKTWWVNATWNPGWDPGTEKEYQREI